ncbi:MAG TPA: symmetrical bis(5'-nucleosyl)-tetraphosphatase [Coxiellaceae bacterium]|nr:MAG: bis(5'-nucleosyl)-tetraphosphatase (symmetrical) [Gammaproteobacteria bacterium RIFCSPHIGHO2_12_FULL_36_30]HLB55740.1 symmetrical bis(5'-nucleosyl)-tetraphosphatase [Coxiellaceae bacterium]
MSTYLIGDVQGCFDSLQALLKKINFNPEKDRLGFVGDLVNRGPKSLEVLQFISQLKNPLVVLGNHDLHFMALYSLRDHHLFKTIPHTLNEILDAPDCKNLINFLLQQPLMIVENNIVMVHAGIPPQWSIEEALQHARDVEKIMRTNPILFFENIYGNDPAIWRDDLTEWDRSRYILNAFTRMRFCSQTGELDLDNKTDQAADEKWRPWFEWIQPTMPIYFGHWASLNGCSTNPMIFALDTGCAWGQTLTAIRLEDHQLFSIKALENEA